MSLSNIAFPKRALEVVAPRPPMREGVAPPRVRLPSKPSPPSRIAVIGNYLPRHCGIATFTTDLCAAISTEYGSARLLALPVNDTEEGYDYPDRVRWSLAQDDVKSYQDAADFLNFNNIDMVCLQHEYGIFGGPAGSHILHLLRGLKMPVVTTLHTVLREPDPESTDGHGRDRRPLRSAHRHEPTVVAVPAGNLQGTRQQDRHGAARRSRPAVLRSEFLQGPFRRGRQGGTAHVRPALAEQGNRKRNSGLAADSCPNTRMSST